MSPISMRRSRARLVSGVLTACAALALGVSGPAYAAPAAESPHSAAPSLNAQVSGHMVAGAVSGSAARAKAGPAAGDFLKEHRSILAANRAANPQSPSTATAAASQLHD